MTIFFNMQNNNIGALIEYVFRQISLISTVLSDAGWHCVIDIWFIFSMFLDMPCERQINNTTPYSTIPDTIYTIPYHTNRIKYNKVKPI